MEKLYNTKKNPLILREYGRNIQKLIELITKTQDKTKRTKLSYGVIKIMKSVNPKVRSISEDSRKLWDDLFIISDYKLDIDAPFPIPEKDIMKKKVSKIPYKQNPVKFKHYGRNVDLLIKKIATEKDLSIQKKILLIILRIMQDFNYTWNKNASNDIDGIMKDLKEMLPNPSNNIDFEDLKNEYLNKKSSKTVYRNNFYKQPNYKNSKWTSS